MTRTAIPATRGRATLATGVTVRLDTGATVKPDTGAMVTPDTAVVTYVPAGKSELKAGARIIAFFKKLPDGSFEANRVSVGLNGLTPPM